MIAVSEGLDRSVSCIMGCCRDGIRYRQMVNDELKMIYYKIPRCASTSVGVFLAKHGFRETAGPPKAIPGYFHFTFSRDPYERAISCCRYARGKNQFIYKYFTAAKIDRASLSFIDFCGMIECIPNHHWDSAYKFIPKGGVDLVVQLEDMVGFDVIQKKIGTNMGFPHLHGSSGAKKDTCCTASRDIVIKKYDDDFRLFGYPT